MGALSPILRSIEGDGLSFWCPGCDGAHVVWVGAGAGPRWGYNGNPARPTFTPSILVTRQHSVPPVTAENLDQFRKKPWAQSKVTDTCHSFVTDGQIRFLGDCTHALAGHTVPLPPFYGDEPE